MGALVELCLLLLVSLSQRANCEEIVFPQMIESRSGGGEKTLKISDKITLNLQKSSVFAEEFFFRTTDEDGQNIAYHMRGAEAEKDIYHDDANKASVSVSDGDGLEVEGVLGHKLRIKPMMGAERSEDGLKPHLLYEIEEPAQEQRLTGYGSVPGMSDVKIEARASTSSPKHKPLKTEIYPEVYLVVDATIAKIFKYKVRKVISYFAVLMNAVNLRYRSFTFPKVQLRVVGLTMNKNKNDETYMVDVPNYQSTRNILFKQTLTKFNEEVEKQAYFKQTDLVMLVTAKNMSEWNGNVLESWTGGYAYIGAACTKWKVGMAEDRPTSYYGVYVIGHEIAHSLGCAHDGEGNKYWLKDLIGSEDCPWDDGYLMSYKMADERQYQFSFCCQREIRNIYNRPNWTCLNEENSHSIIRPSSSLPGMKSSYTNFCRRIYMYNTGVTGAKHSTKECHVTCTLGDKHETWTYTVLDGSPCGSSKNTSCIFGECIQTPEIPKQNASKIIK